MRSSGASLDSLSSPQGFTRHDGKRYARVEKAWSVIHPASFGGGTRCGSVTTADTSPTTRRCRNLQVHTRTCVRCNLRRLLKVDLRMWGGISYLAIKPLLLEGSVPWTFKYPSPAGKENSLRAFFFLSSFSSFVSSQRSSISTYQSELGSTAVTSEATTLFSFRLNTVQKAGNSRQSNCHIPDVVKFSAHRQTYNQHITEVTNAILSLELIDSQ